MSRWMIFAATVLAAGCPSKRPSDPPRPVATDAALRTKIAHLELNRADGVDELRALAASGDLQARELALRGLGRTGGPKAIAVIEAALTDREPRVVSAALRAIGLAGALDDKLEWNEAGDSVSLLSHADIGVRLAAAEALGRAGNVLEQKSLASCVADIAQPPLAAACAQALGRHGRRKLVLSGDARASLIAATSSTSRELRYAATYALAREHEPPADEAVAAALAARVVDELPEIRGTAIAGLGKRKAVGAARASIEQSLRDADWRVAVEAVRALTAADDAGRASVSMSLPRRWADLVRGGSAEAHVIVEALRGLAGTSITDRAALAAIASLAATASTDTKVPTLARGWIACLARVAAPPALTPQMVDAVATCGLPDHLRLPLLADVVKSGVGDASLRRAAMRMLMANDDPRVRAAGLGALPATWKDADIKGQQTIVATLTSALASKNLIVVGAAIDASEALYELVGDPSYVASLDSALVRRADSESDVELSASLFTLIGKRGIAIGADACRRGLAGHRVRAKAARDCLTGLGAEIILVPMTAITPVPPGDIAAVIGKRVVWQLTTSRGPIEIELRPDVAPWAVASIVALTQRGFYDGLELHRVVPNFVAQGGDPTMSGYGGPGYTLPAEPASAADGAGFAAGGVGVADAGPDSGGSQWFLMHGPAPHLDGRYTWIGSVISGQKSADALLIGDRVEGAQILFK